GQVVVAETKFEQQPKPRSEFSNFELLQLLLQALAAKVLARDYKLGKKGRKNTPENTLWARKMTFKEIESLVEDVHIFRILPTHYTGPHQFVEEDITLSPHERAVALKMLRQLANVLRDP